jgi:hypothetical protein
MANVGTQVFGIMAVVAGALVLFAPLGAVLIVAAKSGRGRVLAWAFAGSALAALLWLVIALGLRSAFSPQVAGWWLLSAPWASAMGAVAGWKHARKRYPDQNAA